MRSRVRFSVSAPLCDIDQTFNKSFLKSTLKRNFESDTFISDNSVCISLVGFLYLDQLSIDLNSSQKILLSSLNTIFSSKFAREKKFINYSNSVLSCRLNRFFSPTQISKHLAVLAKSNIISLSFNKNDRQIFLNKNINKKEKYIPIVNFNNQLNSTEILILSTLLNKSTFYSRAGLGSVVSANDIKNIHKSLNISLRTFTNAINKFSDLAILEVIESTYSSFKAIKFNDSISGIYNKKFNINLSKNAQEKIKDNARLKALSVIHNLNTKIRNINRVKASNFIKPFDLNINKDKLTNETITTLLVKNSLIKNKKNILENIFPLEYESIFGKKGKGNLKSLEKKAIVSKNVWKKTQDVSLADSYKTKLESDSFNRSKSNVLNNNLLKARDFGESEDSPLTPDDFRRNLVLAGCSIEEIAFCSVAVEGNEDSGSNSVFKNILESSFKKEKRRYKHNEFNSGNYDSGTYFNNLFSTSSDNFTNQINSNFSSFRSIPVEDIESMWK